MVELGENQLIARLELKCCRQVVQQLGSRDSDTDLCNGELAVGNIQPEHKWLYLFGCRVNEFRSDFICICVCSRRNLGDLVSGPELDIRVQKVGADAGIDQYRTRHSSHQQTHDSATVSRT